MSKFLEWSDVMSVGIEEIDAQHKVLILLINEMHQAIHQRRGSEAVHRILGKLVTHTRLHFAIEESLMRILGYPDYEEHMAEHAKLGEKLLDLVHKIEGGKTPIRFEIMHFLKVWLTKHIVEGDQRYAEFFLRAGAKPRLKRKSWAANLWGHLPD